MTGENDIFTRLRAPLPADGIQWKIQTTGDWQGRKRGLMVPYADARAVRARLNAVLGPENWQSELVDSSAHPGLICRLGLRIDGEWIWKADAGGLTGPDGDGFKGGASDALKRAAANWGIGEHLYTTQPIWVDLDDRGRVLPEGVEELRRASQLIAQSGLVEESSTAVEDEPPEDMGASAEHSDAAQATGADPFGPEAFDAAVKRLESCRQMSGPDGFNATWKAVSTDWRRQPRYRELVEISGRLAPQLGKGKR